MSSLSKIVVIGATGSLGRPVIQELIRAGFFVRAIVRDSSKAKSLLPEPIEIIAVCVRMKYSISRTMSYRA